MSHYLISVLPILLLPHLAGNSASVLSRGLSLPASPTYTLLWSYWPFSLLLCKSRRYISTTKGHPWLAHKLTPVITAWPLPWRQSPADSPLCKDPLSTLCSGDRASNQWTLVDTVKLSHCVSYFTCLTKPDRKPPEGESIYFALQFEGLHPIMVAGGIGVLVKSIDNKEDDPTQYSYFPPMSEELKLWVNGQVSTPPVLPASYPFLRWSGEGA